MSAFMMRVFAIVLAVALLGADPTPAPAVAGRDRLPELVGTWSCRTAYRDPARLYVRRERDAIVMAEEVHYADENVSRTERYWPDPSGAGWRMASGDDPVFEGGAPPWMRADWMVDGQLRYRQARVSVAQHVRYERPDDRTVRITRWSGDSDKGASDVSLCVRGGVMPDESTCIVPNLPATTVRAEEPQWPFGSVRGGMAYVVVSLDAESNVVGARVLRSPSESFSKAALDAARRSVFRTKHVECRPVPGDYVFSVDFQGYM